MEATGRGHFVGVTMSVLQNQDGWWGEGDDMFFVDGETHAVDQWNGLGRLFSGSVGFWRASVCVSDFRGAGRGTGSGGRAVVGISLPPGFSDPVYEVAARDD